MRPVCVVRLRVPLVIALSLNVPFACELGEMDFDIPSVVVGRVQQLEHKFRHVADGNPCGSQPHTDFRCGQVLRLYLFQRLHVALIGFGRQCRQLRLFQLFPDIAG